MKLQHLKLIGAGFLILVLTWSCEGYLDQFNLSRLDTEAEVEPSAALPLAYGSFSLQDVIESLDSTSFVDQTADSLLFVYYRDTILTLSAGEFLQVPDRDIVETYFQSDINIPDWLDIGTGETFEFYKSEELDFNAVGDDRLDSIFIGSGTLIIDIVSDFRHQALLRISSPNMISPEGDSMNLNIAVSDASGNYASTEYFDMTGYKMQILDDADTTTFRLNFALELTKGTAGVSTDEEFGITMGFRDLSFTELYAYISPREVFNIEQSLDLPFFNSISGVLDFAFADPNFKISVHNSFGIPVSIDLSKMEVRSSKDDQYYELEWKNDTMMPFDLNVPTLDQMGETITTTRLINPETSNIDMIISQLPNKIDFNVVANVGDEGEEESTYFLTGESSVAVETELTMPMWLRTSGYTLEDTLDMDLAGILGDFGLLKRANFVLKTVNELPLGLDLQVYFLDEDYVVLDSLFKDNNPFILAAPVDGQGELVVDQLEENLSIVDFSGEELSKLDGTRYMWIRAHAETSNNGLDMVKFYTHYMLNYELSIDAQFRINSEELPF
ncbi:MAG: hypothetical protein K9J30_14585 [Bacteroidales bacterium]|nr:hypothetical protein [Bacteroidales bacterium]